MKSLSIALASALLLALPAYAEDKPTEKDYVIVKVNGDDIKKSEVDDVWKSIFQSSLTPATDKTINLQLLKLQCFPQTLGIRDVICLVAIGTDIGVKTLLCKQDQKGELHFEYKIAPNGKFASSGQSFSDIDRAYNFLISEFGITHISKLKFERYCRQIEWPKLERAAEICFPVDEGEERQVAGKYYY